MALLSDFISIVGIIISIILITLLKKSKNRGLDKTILIIIFCFIFFTCLHTYALIHHLVIIKYFSFLFDYSFFWILGPLLMLYVKSLFLDNTQLLRINRLHFLPAIVITVLVFIPKMISNIFISISFNYLEFYQENQLMFLISRNTFFLIYLFLTIRLFLNLKQNAIKKLNFSLEEYSWINKLLFGSFAFVVIDTSIRSLEVFISLPFDGGYITLFAIVVFLTYLGYHGLNESKILIPAFLLQTNETTDIIFTPKETILLEQKIKDVLENDKLYLDETLSLKRLSESLDISDKKLSAFLNNHLNTKFKDYINFYRVEEVKEKLESQVYNKYTLLAIANDSGFNSKASFYRIFKKHTGFSPSQYKKSILKQ